VTFTEPWEYASISVNAPWIGAFPFESHTQTRVMITPGGASPAGTIATYLVLATACEFSDANITNNLGSGFFGYGLAYDAFFDGTFVNNGINPGLPYGGDIGLPPEWLQINGQTLLDTGMTNSQVAYSGYYPSINSVWGGDNRFWPGRRTHRCDPCGNAGI
jgi:hypothetical protein